MHVPFVYQKQVVAYFKTYEKLWRSHASADVRQADYQVFKEQLLKDTRRLTPDTAPAVYAAVEKARNILGIAHQVTVYQLVHAAALNAFVYASPGGAHIVCSGELLQLLDEKELLAVIAHELGHVRLLAADDGDYLVADRILNTLTGRADTAPEYIETARRYDLYTELYCDQVALAVTGDPAVVISSLVKLNTGLEDFSAESYIRQAIEIVESGTIKSQQMTHPEIFIRAYAIHLAQVSPETLPAKLQAVIEGRLELHQLDLFSKIKLQQYTRQVIAALLSAGELQTGILINLAQQYFADFKKEESQSRPEPGFMNQCDDRCKEYIAYVLLDFAQADQDIEAGPFRNAFVLATELGLKETLKELIKKELKLSEKKFTDRYKKTLAVYA